MYEYSDQYFKNFKGTNPRNPRNPFNPPKILGETPLKEFTRKVAKPVLQTARGLATGPVGQVAAAGAGGYLLGTAVDQAYRAVPGSGGMPLSENIAEKIMPVNDGKYDPNRAPNPEFIAALQGMEQRAMEQGLPPYMMPEQRLTSDFNQAMSPTGAPTGTIMQEGFSVPIERTLPMSDNTQLNQQQAIGDFSRTMNEATGAPMGTIMQEGFNVKVPEAEMYPGYANSPLGRMTEILKGLPEGISDDQRAEIAGRMLAPYLRDPAQEVESRANYEAASKAQQDRLKAMRTGSDANDTEVQKTGLSMTDYRNLAKQELGRGTPNQAINARANQLQLEDQKSAKATKLEEDALELDKKYKEGVISRQEFQDKMRVNEYNFKVEKYKDEEQKLSAQEIADGGRTALSNINSIVESNQAGSISEEDQAMLNYYISSMAGKDSPLLDRYDSVQLEELVTNGRYLPSILTKDGELSKKEILDASEKGFQFIFIDGRRVSVQEMIDKFTSQQNQANASKEVSDLRSNKRAIRNLPKSSN